MTKHTPGPWIWESDKCGCLRVGPASERGEWDHPTDILVDEVCCTSGLHDEDVDRANARLIAATPEMYSLLTEMDREWGLIMDGADRGSISEFSRYDQLQLAAKTSALLARIEEVE